MEFVCYFCKKTFGKCKSQVRRPHKAFCSKKCRYKNEALEGMNRIIKKIAEKHGDLIKLEESTYVDTRHKCKFIDKDYGGWWAFPQNVAAGRGNPDRAGDKQFLDIKEINIRIREKHGNNIKIDESTYIDTNHKCMFIDKDFGAWFALPRDIIRGHGHSKRVLHSPILTPIDEIEKRLVIVHEGKVKIVKHTYKSMDKKAKFVDIDYGHWWATPSNVIGQKQKNPERGYAERKESTLDILEVKKKIKLVHGDNIEIDETTYSGVSHKARFIDKKYGVWWTVPQSIIHGCGHPDGAYIKQALSSNFSYTLYHWKTGEEIICLASYEKKVVEYLNKHKINFRWQSKAFIMPNGKTYRPDLYLFSTKQWIEIKGFFRKDAEEKWNWFHTEHPNSELWNKEKLVGLNIL